MNRVSGTVEAIARNGKAFMLAEDPDIWYSAPRGKSYDPEKMKGAEVSFEYKENPKGDTVFYNIQGDVEIVGEAPSRPSRSSSPARGKAVGGKERGNGTDGVDGDAFRKRSMKYFPMPADDVDRPIVRQNALTQANMLYRTLLGENGDRNADGSINMVSSAEEVITIARIFEAYSTGEV